MLVARAPMRISFAGGGTDLPAYYEKYGGMVVSTAIDKYVYVIVSPNGRDSLQLSSSDYSTFIRLSTTPLGVRVLTLGGGLNAVPVERLASYANAFNLIWMHPSIGSGPGAYQLQFTYLSVNQPGWLSNVELRILVEGGVLGLTIFGAFCWSVLRSGWRSARTGTSTFTVTLLVMLLPLVICFQVTDGTTLAFVWLIAGGLVVAARAAGHPSRTAM